MHKTYTRLPLAIAAIAALFLACSTPAGAQATAGMPASTGIFGPSGTSHATGLVPDPGATANTTRYLREDGTWQQVTTSGSPADISTPGIFGTVNADLATIAIVNGVAHASSAKTFDADLLWFSANLPACYLTGTFTGTGSGTTLTVTLAQTALAPGSLLTGTNIPVGTKILNQVSGITGFAGVYTTTNATTLNGSASNSFQFNDGWVASVGWVAGDTIIDSNNNFQTVTTAGTSSATAPTWSTSGTTTDGSVTWTYGGSAAGSESIDCAAQKAALYSSQSHNGATLRIHTGNYNQNYTIPLPYRAYSSASLAIIGDGSQQAAITATSPMTSMVQSMYPGGPNSSGPVIQGISFNANYKSQNGLVLDNTDHIGLRDISVANNDAYHGLGNSNTLLSLLGGGDTHAYDVHLGSNAGLNIYSGRSPEIQVVFSGGQISQFIMNQAAKTFVPGGGTGGTVGTFYWTGAPVSGSCVVPPSGRAFVSVAGAGYSSGTVDAVGECFVPPGTAFTLTYTGGSTVTGDSSSLTFWTLYNVGSNNDPYGNPYVPHLELNGYGAYYSWPCSVMPAKYQGTNSGGANYNPQFAGQLVNEATFNLSSDGTNTLQSIVPNATHTESGCNGTMFASIVFGPVDYTLANFTMNDGGAEKFYLISGARIGMVVTGGNPYIKNFHAQTATGILWNAGVGTIQDYEDDGNGNTGIDIRTSTVKVKGGFYGNNGSSYFPGSVVVRTETTNSSQNSQISDMLCSGTPGDAVNFRSFVNTLGDFSTTTPYFQAGQVVRDWAHCSNEHNLAQEILNEQRTVQIANGTMQDTIIQTLSGTVPAITATENGFYNIVLSGNTAPTITGIAAKQNLYFHICQPSSGGPYTWTWPSAFRSPASIGTTASTCTNQEFVSFDGSTLTPMGAGITGVTP